jgi:hypothetical protein
MVVVFWCQYKVNLPMPPPCLLGCNIAVHYKVFVLPQTQPTTTMSQKHKYGEMLSLAITK